MPNVMPFQVTKSQAGPVPGARHWAVDVDGFEQLYRQHAPRLYALATRISGSPAEGEDLVQDIFVQAFRKLEGFRGQSAVGTWLYRLAVNCCLDYVRSRRGKMAKRTTTLEMDRGWEPAIRDDRAGDRIDLERAIRLLPDGCREVFVLHDVEGFNHQEIATMLSIAQGTSKSHLFRARQKLRAILK